VFNSTSWSCTAPVRAPLRELDNSGSVMHAVPPEKDAMGIGFLKGVLLGNRFHTILPQEMVDGSFRLVDVETGRVVEHQIVEINSPMEPLPYAAERLGIGSGTKRYGFFEKPIGLKRDLCFVAEDVPAMGYRVYRLVPAEEPQQTTAQAQPGAIENEYYRVSVDASGSIASIFDKEAGRELVDDSCGHGFFRLLVRQGNSPEVLTDECIGVEVKSGAVLSSITVTAKTHGHPAIVKTVTLYQGVRQIYLDMKALKDSTPLLNVHVGFPFAAQKPQFRYEGSLSVMNPIRDYLTGSYSDAVAVQNWVKVKDGGYSILWSSLDAPMAGFARLWPGYVSPAHRCILNESVKHPPQTQADLSKGWVYSQLFNNNFGTNFSVSQCGEALFRYVLTTAKGEVSDTAAARFGWQAAMPLEKILTDRGTPGNPLPPCGCFLEIDSSDVAVVNLKRVEDGRGFILRLWNMGGVAEQAALTFPLAQRVEASKTSLCEEDAGEPLSCHGNTIEVAIAAGDICTLRITGL
jgi:alpha-mannosidase